MAGTETEVFPTTAMGPLRQRHLEDAVICTAALQLHEGRELMRWQLVHPC